MKSAMKTLLLVRHAHRDTQMREMDNGLSSQGVQQGLDLREKLEKLYDLKNAVLFSSPKKRCRETLSPIEKKFENKIKVEDALDERGSNETLEHFNERIADFIEKWESNDNSLTLACSHGDWLPLALEHLNLPIVEFKKSGWVAVVLKNKNAKLQLKTDQ